MKMPNELLKGLFNGKDIEILEYTTKISIKVETESYDKMIIITPDDIFVFNDKEKNEKS